ncbi:hypothetical protein BKA63DRAFT_43075 [Paraphoma chrysanthemicola]|nr:hypothetical protein BKA63DRAFT_43075 [Paraphoma chrysanthemicola]
MDMRYTLFFRPLHMMWAFSHLSLVDWARSVTVPQPQRNHQGITATRPEWLSFVLLKHGDDNLNEQSHNIRHFIRLTLSGRSGFIPPNHQKVHSHLTSNLIPPTYGGRHHIISN